MTTLRGVGFCAVLAMSATAAFADDAPKISISDAWIRWLPNDLPAAGYATIDNEGDRPARLVGATSPDYGNVMLHRSINVDGVGSMVKVDGVDIDPGKSFVLAPGGYHLMLMQAKHPIAPGDTVKLRFEFADGTGIDADVEVQPASATDADE